MEEEQNDEIDNGLSKAMDKFWHTIDDTILRHKKTLKVLSVLIIIILAVIYFVYATTYWHRHGKLGIITIKNYFFIIFLFYQIKDVATSSGVMVMVFCWFYIS